jgi:hypothetical protein
MKEKIRVKKRKTKGSSDCPLCPWGHVAHADLLGRSDGWEEIGPSPKVMLSWDVKRGWAIVVDGACVGK